MNKGEGTKIAEVDEVLCGREPDATVIVVDEGEVFVPSGNVIRTDVDEDGWCVKLGDLRTGLVGNGRGYDESVGMFGFFDRRPKLFEEFRFVLRQSDVPGSRSPEIAEDSVELVSSVDTAEPDMNNDLSSCHAVEYSKWSVRKTNEISA